MQNKICIVYPLLCLPQPSHLTCFLAFECHSPTSNTYIYTSRLLTILFKSLLTYTDPLEIEPRRSLVIHPDISSSQTCDYTSRERIQPIHHYPILPTTISIPTPHKTTPYIPSPAYQFQVNLSSVKHALRCDIYTLLQAYNDRCRKAVSEPDTSAIVLFLRISPVVTFVSHCF